MKFDVKLVRPVLSGAVSTLLSRPALFVAPTVVMFAAMIATDWLTLLQPEAGPLFNLITTVTSLFVIAWVTVIVLRETAGIAAAKPWPIGSLFLVSFLGGLGMLLGLILLILPGLYVAGRWFLACTVVVSEGRGGSDALGESWKLLEEDWLAAVIITVFFGVGGMAGVAISVLSAAWYPSWAIAGMITGNAIAAIFQVVAVVAATLFYSTVRGTHNYVDEVFG